MNDLVKIDTLEPSNVITKAGIKSLVEEVTKKVQDTPKDITTKKGREEINSLAYQVSRSKTAVAEMIKEAKAPHQKCIDDLNALLGEWQKDMDDLRDATKKPVIEYDERENKRKQAHKDRMTNMETLAANPGTTPEQIESSLQSLDTTYQGEWEEYSEMARDVYAASKEKLQVALSNANLQRQKDEELERLRKEKAEQEAKAEQDRLELEQLRKEKAEREVAAAQNCTPDVEKESGKGEQDRLASGSGLSGQGAQPHGEAPTDPAPTEPATTTNAPVTTNAAHYPTPLEAAAGITPLTTTAPNSVVIADGCSDSVTLPTMQSLIADMYDVIKAKLHDIEIGYPEEDIADMAEQIVDAIEEKLKAILKL